MPFESLSEKIQMSLRRVTGRGRLNENDIDEMMKEVRLSLLEADVNYKVVKEFTNKVKEKAVEKPDENKDTASDTNKKPTTDTNKNQITTTEYLEEYTEILKKMEEASE